MKFEWRSEANELPPIAQKVMFAVPRQFGEFWDLHIAQLLVRHEAVIALPVPKGSRWPTDFWWSTGRDSRDTHLVTGNGWWAPLDKINLPPGAKHLFDGRFHYVSQPKSIFVSQTKPAGFTDSQ